MSTARELRERADELIAEYEIEARRCSELPADMHEAAAELRAALVEADAHALAERWEAEAANAGPNGRAAAEANHGSWPTMADAAYIGLPGDIVRAIGPHTESDPVALLLNEHEMFGSAVGRGPYYLVEGTRHYANLYGLLVGATSKARKGTATDRTRQIFRAVDADWSERCVHTGLSSGEGVIWAVRDPIEQVKDGELVIVDAGAVDKRLMLIEPEFAGVLRIMQREGNILSRVLRDGWDRGDLATLTKHSPARATGAHVSILGHITADELRRYLNLTEIANGFANRFLFACCKRAQLLPHGGHLSEESIAGLAGRVAAAVEAARGISRVTMTDQAAAMWTAIDPELTADRPGLGGALTARSEAQVIRLALVYALWDASDRIGPKHLRAAVAVWEYCEASINHVFGDAIGDHVADAILSALRAAGTAGMTRTAISGTLGRNVPASQIDRALCELVRHSLAEARERSDGPGRPAQVWHAR